MRSIKSVSLAALIVMAGSAYSAEEEMSLAGFLVAAKFLGGCGIFSQMAKFQESTKMLGGNEFIERFYTVESARLGLSPLEYGENCRKAEEMYQLIYSEASGSQEKK